MTGDVNHLWQGHGVCGILTHHDWFWLYDVYDVYGDCSTGLIASAWALVFCLKRHDAKD